MVTTIPPAPNDTFLPTPTILPRDNFSFKLTEEEKKEHIRESIEALDENGTLPD